MGFLRIAHQARVPIMPVGIDYKSKSFNLGELMETSGDMHADMAKIREHFRQFTGKIPTKAG
jgi:1-acyl-sn-glycerol-3-phosphate acyltransferase